MGDSLISWAWILSSFQAQNESISKETFESLVAERVSAFQNIRYPLRGSVQASKATEKEEEDCVLSVYKHSYPVKKSQKEFARRLSDLTGFDEAEVLYVILSYNDEFMLKYSSYSNDDAFLVQEFQKRYYAELFSCWKVFVFLLRACADPNHFWYKASKYMVVATLEQSKKSNPREPSAYCIDLIAYFNELSDQAAPIQYTLLGEATLAHWYFFYFHLQLQLLRVLFLLIYSLLPCTSEVAIAWFSCMKKTRFLHDQEFMHLDMETGFSLCNKLTYLATVISVTIISLDKQVLPFQANDAFFMTSGDCILKIQDIMSSFLGDPIGSVVALTWGIALHNLHNSPENLSTVQNSSVVSHTLFKNPQTSYQSMIISAVRLDPFSLMHSILNGLQDDVNYDGYLIILAVLFAEAISYVKFSSSVIFCATTLFKNPQIFEMFSDIESVAHLFSYAGARFPFELSQFPLLLTPVLSSLNLQRPVNPDFNLNTTFTQVLPKGFKSYEIIPEPNVTTNVLIELQDSLPLEQTGFFFPNPEKAIPKGTRGRIVSVDTFPPIVMWDVVYPRWPCIGISLQHIVTNNLYHLHDEFLVTFLHALVDLYKSNTTEIRELTRLVSISLEGEYDFIDLICSVLDHYLSNSSLSDTEYQICVLSCQLLCAFVHIEPTSIWAYASRSLQKVLSLGNVIFEHESLSGVYDFTLAFFELYELLLDNCISTSVIPDDFSINLKSEFAKQSIQCFCEIFANFLDWRYSKIIQQYEIGCRFTSLITKLLNVIYGIEYFGSKVPNKRILPLQQLGNYVVQRFLVQQDAKRYLHPLLSILDRIDPLYTEIFSSTDNKLAEVAKNWLVSSLETMQILIDLRGFLNLKPSELERDLFSRSPQLFYALPQIYPCVGSILRLLTSLILAPWPSETPSLLAYMVNFTDVVGRVCVRLLENPIHSSYIEGCVWKFLSSIMKGQQQGLAVLLFSGKKFPLENMKSLRHNEQTQITSRSLINLAEKRMDNFFINDVSTQVPIIEFIFLSRNFWSASYGTAQQETDFWKKVIDAIKLPVTVSSPELLEISKADLYVLAAHAVRIAAIQLHIAKFNKCVSAKKLVIDPLKDCLHDLIQSAFTITTYDPSVFETLNNNFERFQSELNAMSLKNTGITPPVYGKNYFYNTHLAKAMLSVYGNIEPMISSMGSANDALSTLDAQTALLRSWSIFLSAFIDFVKEDSTLSFLDFDIMNWILESLGNDTVDSFIIRDLSIERAALVFHVSQHAMSAPLTDGFKERLESLMVLTWQALSTDKFSLFEVDNGLQMNYYRPLLQVLYNGLNKLLSNANQKVNIEVGFVSGILSMCHRKLSQLFQHAITEPTPDVHSDIVLLNAIQNVIVNSQLIKGLQSVYISHIMDHSSVENCLRLFSWSHALLIDGQPYFADAALSFLVTCSSIPAGAEQVASQGVFFAIAESPLSSLLKTGGLGADVSSVQYKLWIRGILPLLFNIVKYLGNRTMNDAREFILLVLPQIQFSFLNWSQPPSSVSLASIDESFMLVLLMDLLQYFNPALLQEIRVSELKAEMLNGIDYLISHPNFLSSLAEPATLYEQEYAIEVIGLPKEDAEASKETKTQFAKLIRMQLDKLRAHIES
ncbi:nucleoporin Nup184 [Schizosaccharomyces cryophilus OY26]|uniref:Nucleoporin Nup184 n=1 Tax=Schizosaccharomyces cryophilus (strain OY26 / ATCC MYA-4695 / CBS 11777 / NBRC 106824 / NRRL Y48691) TaxID=653667 RepID=S9VYY4_SCHCR|nr:nucleoporin Nup184 [Schizosaccharomyces cryophilus OY26]EPY51035.1 nucleoporin Nup184 [Schizosaccharomyces cryophilus OY26]